MIETLFISKLDIPTCLQYRTTGTLFAVVGNRSQIPLFIGVPCAINIEERPLEAIEEVIGRLQDLRRELE